MFIGKDGTVRGIRNRKVTEILYTWENLTLPEKAAILYDEISYIKYKEEKLREEREMLEGCLNKIKQP